MAVIILMIVICLPAAVLYWWAIVHVDEGSVYKDEYGKTNPN